ncbi:MAG: hypothetical protein IRZ02_02635 [Acidothermus sp.]|nr:hypothetical protein [Acidothermus sp.]MCL6537717.1 hypothetical protein [Acidothermus sp.]
MIESHEIPKVNFTVVDGIPTFWSDAPGPIRSALTFRVGTSDEPIRLRGATHLAGHLALAPFGVPRCWDVLTTDYLFSTLCLGGSPDDLVAIYDAACSQLRSVASSELVERERRVITSEGPTSPSSVGDELMFARYGWVGPGRASFKEIGLADMSPAMVHTWCETWFTKRNAVLVLSCPPPPNLRIELPEGTWRLPPPLPPTLGLLPCRIEGWPGVAFQLVIRGHPASLALAVLLRRRLLQVLRFGWGLTADVHAVPTEISADDYALSVSIKVPSDYQSKLEELVYAMLTDAVQNGFTDDEIATWRELARQDQSDDVLYSAWRMARQYLLGTVPTPPEEWLAEATNSDLLHERLRQAWEQVVFGVSDGSSVIGHHFPELRFPSSPPLSSRPASGGDPGDPSSRARSRGFCSQNRRCNGEQIFVNEEGIQIGRGRRARRPIGVVRWADCVLVERRSDNSRKIWGKDGQWIVVRPKEWYRERRLVDAIDRWTPPQIVIDIQLPRRPRYVQIFFGNLYRVFQTRFRRALQRRLRRRSLAKDR